MVLYLLVQRYQFIVYLCDLVPKNAEELTEKCGISFSFFGSEYVCFSINIHISSTSWSCYLAHQTHSLYSFHASQFQRWKSFWHDKMCKRNELRTRCGKNGFFFASVFVWFVFGLFSLNFAACLAFHWNCIRTHHSITFAMSTK